MARSGKTRGSWRTAIRRPLHAVGAWALVVSLLLCLSLSGLHPAGGHCGVPTACLHAHGKPHQEATETHSGHEPCGEPDHDEGSCLICQWLAGEMPSPDAEAVLVTHSCGITRDLWLSEPVLVRFSSSVPSPRGPPSAHTI